MIVSSVYTPSLILPLIKYGVCINRVAVWSVFILQLQCTDVSWSSSGALLVASYPLL